jgi:GNAT superfamily N-acetyltransferase
MCFHPGAMKEQIAIRPASVGDVPLILRFVRELAAYEKLTHEVTATEDLLRRNLFGEHSSTEVLLAEWDGHPAGFAVFFQNFSTFLGKPGIYLEDLFVLPEFRGRGCGKAMMVHLARLARRRDCGRFEWAVLDWNKPSLDFYHSIGALPLEEWTVQRLTGPALAALAAQKLPGET